MSIFFVPLVPFIFFDLSNVQIMVRFWMSVSFSPKFFQLCFTSCLSAAQVISFLVQQQLPSAQILAVDRCPNAVFSVEAELQRQGERGRIRVKRSDLFEALKEEVNCLNGFWCLFRDDFSYNSFGSCLIVKNQWSSWSTTFAGIGYPWPVYLALLRRGMFCATLHDTSASKLESNLTSLQFFRHPGQLGTCL